MKIIFEKTETTVKCMISRYDESIKEAPFLTIQIDKMVVEKPNKDNLGEALYERLKHGCYLKGYRFKFYTTSEDKEYKYNVVVY